MRLPGILRHGFTLHGLGMGLSVFLLLRVLGLALDIAAMLGWSAHILTYATLLLHRLANAPAEAMRRRARAMTEGRAMVTGLSVLAAGVSLLLVVLRKDGLDGAGGMIAIVAIVLSWFYVHLLFAQDYAHEFWMQERGLVFPGSEPTPGFAEFLYVAFTIGMTFQVSDVTTDSPGMRRLVLLHGLVAFAFNAMILAAAVNIVAGAGG